MYRVSLSDSARKSYGGDARNSVGLSLAIEKDAALYYRHGMKMQGSWVTEGSLEDGPPEKLEQELRSLTQGLDHFHRTALLEEGVEWKDMGGECRWYVFSSWYVPPPPPPAMPPRHRRCPRACVIQDHHTPAS